MPDDALPDPATEDHYNNNVRQQVVAQLASGSITAATEGRMYAVTNRDRYEFDTGSVMLPGPPWGTAGRVGFEISDATNRSIPNGAGSFTSLTFATEVTDTDGFITAPGTTVTIPANRGGIYLGYCTFTWASSPGTNSAKQLLLNGVQGHHRVIGGGHTQGTIDTFYILGAFAAGETLQIQLSQASGGAINVNPSVWEMWRLSA